MDATIQDVCKEAKEQQHKSLKDISDLSEVSINTVTNFFSSASKQPSFYTVGPICKALGVSMDSYYGIQSSESDLRARLDELTAKLHEAELLQTRTDAQREMYANALKNSRRSSVILVVLSFLLTLSLLAYLLIDANIHNAGLIQSGKPSGVAVVLMVLAALSIVALLYVAVSLIKKHK